MDFNTVSITDYKVVSANVAKVVISYTGKHTKESLQKGIAAKFEGKAAPVENSFKQIRAGVAVGFVRANLDIRIPSDKELKASYRKIGASNIMMDSRDKSLWAVKKGAAGTYLARHAQEDLSELVEASVTRRHDVPSLGSMVSAGAARKEFASFVTEAGDMDYGFITAVSTKGDKLKIMSSTTRVEHVVKTELCTGFYQVGIPKSVHARVLKAGVSPQDKTVQKDYYEKVFSYAPEYLAEVKAMIDEGTDA